MSRRIESLVVHQLREQNSPEARTAFIQKTLSELGARFEPGIVDLIAEEAKTDAAALTGHLSALQPTPNSAYLKALLAGDSPEAGACAVWEDFFRAHYSYDPFHRLAYTRALTAAGRYSEAVRQLSLALSQEVRYAFFPRAEKLVQTLASHNEAHLREARVAVLGSSTTNLLVPVLQALCLRDRIKVESYQGLYGAMEQEILDPESGLGRFRPDVVFLVNHWRDLTPADPTAPGKIVDNVVSRHHQMWERLSARFACHVVQHCYDFPAEDAWGPLSDSLPGGRARIIAAINRRLVDEAPSFVSILDLPAVQRKAGTDRWEDPVLWHRFKQHPATESLPLLAEAQAAQLRAVLGLTRKVMVLDLDNTLWKGVIGEDGLQGIEVGPGTAYGEAHARLQEYLKELKARGILLAVCSKNNPDDAKLPFEKHAHMVLRLDDFAAFEANWTDKAQTIRNIAERLSLGLESFVFLDDSPIEREWVRSQLPQVAVIEPASSVFHYVRDLDRSQYFFAPRLSGEDLARAEQYRTESQRELLRGSAQSLDEFLNQLQLQASAVPVSAANLTRVTQLANKTNQFNLTTRRYTEAQIHHLAVRQDCWAGAFHLTDRMGSYGLIGLILCVPTGSLLNGPPREWEIETWLMSCRALGRQMERFMFDRLIAAAVAAGIQTIRAVYKPTAKNHLVEDLCDRLGFEAAGGDGEKRYRLAVPGCPVRTATHVRDLTNLQEDGE